MDENHDGGVVKVGINRHRRTRHVRKKE